LYLQGQHQRDIIRPILVEKRAQNELLESSANWLIDTMKHLTTISNEPISVQYDQGSNRLKDLLNETQLIYSRIKQINPTIKDDLSFHQNHLQLTSHLEDAQKNINKLIKDREQTQLSVQTLDQNVSEINQNIKVLRTNLEQYRLSDNNIQELQVKTNNNNLFYFDLFIEIN